jgi:hypothetical protein
MATIEQFHGPLRLVVREALKKCLAEGGLPEAQEGESRFTTIETLAVRGDRGIVDVLSRKYLPKNNLKISTGLSFVHCFNSASSIKINSHKF